ncbi:hypothetical protein NIES37_48140 [Tolypothrix tenuis PCC 7101]|uniref:Uncharacterized protein n=1 Tax=Tolypothrix tenuis PCC 7101 TaxID=231146 RepID=A0A1Z4N520_9CYAN|nr:hypothetical protein [Aulosira sp. FACHB-113]BAZ00818.1 hypothetical protein NIES37_48140 [Tolypothrix tenuis PCC 7101]BAZ75259.1 hypothetical protein NIES50_38410 [Aulosira laxa NIES-50]
MISSPTASASSTPSSFFFPVLYQFREKYFFRKKTAKKKIIAIHESENGILTQHFQMQQEVINANLGYVVLFENPVKALFLRFSI